MGEWVGIATSGTTVQCLFVTGRSGSIDPNQQVVDGPTDAFLATLAH